MGISICLNNSPWLDKTVAELTIADAVMAAKEGFYLICGDGKVQAITNEKSRTIRKGGK